MNLEEIFRDIDQGIDISEERNIVLEGPIGSISHVVEYYETGWDLIDTRDGAYHDCKSIDGSHSTTKINIIGSEWNEFIEVLFSGISPGVLLR